MKTAYIFHDSFAEPFSDWYPWMKTTLEAAGYRVLVPSFPTPAGQSLASWSSVVRNFAPTFDEDTVLIGHGTGALLALRLAEQSAKQLRALILVSAYAEPINHAGYDRVNESFLANSFDWNTIKSRAMVIRVVAGTDDPFVPKAATANLAGNLGVHVDEIAEGGHLNRASGFVQFVQLAGMVRETEASIGSGMEATTETADSNAVQMPTGDAGVSFETTPEPVVQPEPAAAPIAPIPAASESTGVRTMYQDMSQLVNSSRGDVASSLLNQARAEEEQKKDASPVSSRNVLYIIGSIALVLGAVAAIAWIVLRYAPAATNQTGADVPSLITAETHTKVEIGSSAPYAVAGQIRAALGIAPAEDTVRDVYYMNGSARATFPQTLEALDVSTLPDLLSGEFSQPAFMHGSSTISGMPAHFLVLPAGNYDVAFRGMREWEQTMFRDTGIFMNVSDGFLRAYTSRDAFADEMVANRPLRVLRYKKPVELAAEPEAVQLETAPTESEGSEPPQEEPVEAGGPIGGEPAEAEQGAPEEASEEPVSNFVSESVTNAVRQNPFVNVASPYAEGDVMLAYFFLTERTVVVVDNLEIIPEILTRFANRQIYE